MSPPDSYEYTRYLAVKRSIDEQSINQRVWHRLIDEMREKQRGLRILELGAGLGATAERILDAAPVPTIHYTLVDHAAPNIDRARENLRRWAEEAGYSCQSKENVLEARCSDRKWTARFVVADAFDFVEAAEGTWDVLVAQAFLDLVNVREMLARIQRVLVSGALLYLPIHFDGLTAFEPVDEPSLHRRILRAYHDTMDERQTPHGPSGGSQAGRSLVTALRGIDGSILSAGSSDWVVLAGPNGFSDAETYFLHCMLHFVETSVGQHPEITREELRRWLESRRRRIEDDSLVFIAHQLDVLAQFGH